MLRVLPAVALAAVLAACGGGGGGAPAPPMPTGTAFPSGTPSVPPTATPTPSATPSPTPSPSPTPAIANSTLVSYVPLGIGNTWQFSSRSRMVDRGTFRLSCTCPFPWGLIEQIDVFDSSGAFGGSLFFSKQVSTSGSVLTDLIGIERLGSPVISLIYDNAFPQGLPIVDDAPVAGETWTVFAGGTQPTVSTIVSTGGVLPLQNGTQIIAIASDRIDQGFFANSVTLSMARGVGFTGVSMFGRSISVTNFRVQAFPVPDGTLPLQGFLQPADVTSVLSRLFF